MAHFPNLPQGVREQIEARGLDADEVYADLMRDAETRFPRAALAHDRLNMRGIDPEQSYIAWGEAIRSGHFPLTPDGLPVKPRKDGRPLGWKQARALTPIPLAVVIP